MGVRISPCPQHRIKALEDSSAGTAEVCDWDNVLDAIDVGARGPQIKSIVQNCHYAAYRDHDEHSDNPPQHVLFALLVVSPFAKLEQKHDKPPKEQKKSGGKY